MFGLLVDALDVPYGIGLLACLPGGVLAALLLRWFESWAARRNAWPD
jgi:hypothetical protein